MKFSALILPGIAAVLFSSCASVSVRNENRAGSQPAQKPAMIYVADFGTQQGAFKIAGSESKDPETFKKKISGMLANYTAIGINTHVSHAQRVGSTTSIPRGSWLVTGEFVRVNTGSRVLRAGVGLGAGGTKMETKVSVYDATTGPQPFLVFETTGGSNAMPGLLTSTGPGSAAFSILTQSMMGVTDDAARTSRMITGALNEYFIDRGWLEKSQRYSVKRLGKYQLVHEQYTQ